MKVSIGLPVYNGARFVRRAIDSMLAQTYRDFELVISDNGSTDETSEICREYAARDERIRYHRHDTTIPAAENFICVFNHARGEYFQWLAADDSWADTWLARAVEVLDARSEVALVFSQYEILNLDTGDLTPGDPVIASLGSLRARVLVRLLNPVANIFYGLFRRGSVTAADIVAIDFGDVLFATKMALKGDIHVLSEPLFRAGVRKRAPRRAIVRPYLKRACALTWRSFKGVDRFVFTALTVKQVVGFWRHYRRYAN